MRNYMDVTLQLLVYYTDTVVAYLGPQACQCVHSMSPRPQTAQARPNIPRLYLPGQQFAQKIESPSRPTTARRLRATSGVKGKILVILRFKEIELKYLYFVHFWLLRRS